MKPEGSWFCSPFNGALGEQCWVLGPISSACMCISCNDTFGWKTHAVSEADTIADCKVVAHQLKQEMLLTCGIITGWFHHSWKTQSTIYTIFGGKMPRICVSTSSVSWLYCRRCMIPPTLSVLLSAIGALLVKITQWILGTFYPSAVFTVWQT